MATVIKIGEQDPRLLRRLETLDISDHLAEARKVVNAARQQAEQMLREAQAEGQRLLKHSSEKGYEQGFRRGYDAGQKAGFERAFKEACERFHTEQASLVEAMRALIDGYERAKRDLFIDARDDVVRFAVRAAEKVARRIGAINREAVQANLEAALALVESRTNLVVTVNPRDKEALERFAAALDEQSKGTAHLRLVADASISPGGCVVAAADGEVDATLDAQLSQIAELLCPGGTAT